MDSWPGPLPVEFAHSPHGYVGFLQGLRFLPSQRCAHEVNGVVTRQSPVLQLDPRSVMANL